MKFEELLKKTIEELDTKDLAEYFGRKYRKLGLIAMLDATKEKTEIDNFLQAGLRIDSVSTDLTLLAELKNTDVDWKALTEVYEKAVTEIYKILGKME